MRTKHHTFLIVFSLMLLLASGYVYFSFTDNVRAATSPLSSSTAPADGTDSVDQKIAEDTAFLSTLTSLTKITIDTSIFNDKAFKALNDNTVVLEQATAGRPNPFANIDSAGLVAVEGSELVITNDPTQVADRTAVLNGTVTASTGVTSVYFEYGTTQSLGKATVPAKQSLIGSFVTSVAGLLPKTEYFFRAVAKINNATVYGGIISFTTK